MTRVPMHEMKVAGMVILAALTGWFVRGIGFERLSEPSPPPRLENTVPRSETVAEPVPVVMRAVAPASSLGRRNLFAYEVHDVAPVIVEHAAVQPLPVMVDRPVYETPVREAVPFPYEYIGTFGSAATRIAAFKRDGDVYTVRAGERIGDFVVRSIAPESVEVEGPDGILQQHLQ